MKKGTDKYLKKRCYSIPVQILWQEAANTLRIPKAHEQRFQISSTTPSTYLDVIKLNASMLSGYILMNSEV